ncbi:MAG: DNA repair protein RadC [Clostridiales bacterium]|jgi:DNA repair protein RadC|nr:DNA repair protein RadC [Clostridiales bacterium]
MKQNPHVNHRKRVRERYRSQGLDGFAEHEVLELLLFHCYPRCDTNEIAHNMLQKFGSLHNLFEADIETLTATLNCSENVAVFLNLIPAVTKRYFFSKWGAGIIISNEKIAGEFAIDLFVGQTVESFYVICLNKKFKLINVARISKGTTDEAPVYSREIVREAIKNNATDLILTHNHPGGVIKPSRNDIDITRRIIEGVEIMNLGIKVIDHIVVCGDTYYSFAARRQHVQGYK